MPPMTHHRVKQQMYTIDASVARNWHINGVPNMLTQQIVELDALIVEVRGIGEEGYVTAFTSDRDEIKAVLDDFLALWPEPARETLTDTTRTVSEAVYFEAFSRATFSQSPPNEPLTLLRYAGELNTLNSTLLYHNAKGQTFKVPNMPYNRPNTRIKTTWPDKYKMVA